jgi:hypothetical protein
MRELPRLESEQPLNVRNTRLLNPDCFPPIVLPARNGGL